MVVIEITKIIDLRHEYKSGGFHLLWHAARIDAMQGFGIAKPGTRCGRVIDDDQHAARFERVEERLFTILMSAGPIKESCRSW
jgi:hypothetical protein